MTDMPTVRVIGAGLAGAEAAFQAATCGVNVELYEMKPHKRSPAHHADGFAELVCSNSLRSDQVHNAVGLLKAELRLLGSLILEAADRTAVPAGSALAVNRHDFSAYVTERIRSHPRITVIEEEVTSLDPSVITVVATGPLTSDALASHISSLTGGGELHFFDAAAPIIDVASIDMSRAFFASRYGKGDPEDYLNCPLTKEEYDAFYEALVHAELAPLKSFDEQAQADLTVFEGCMPVEVMASRGYDTLRYGPMKPVGLPCPDTGRDAYATVQLRRENREGTMYNMVGFQTHLTFGEQKRVFSMIPGLAAAEFLRYGVMHRNTYLNSPGLLTDTYAMRRIPTLYFAGQMTGVEGYVESAASGLLAAIHIADEILKRPTHVFDERTVCGALETHISTPCKDFQPMNANFGILTPMPVRIRDKKERYRALAERALECVREIAKTL